MQWMGGWSWEDLLCCPMRVRDEIVAMINEEDEYNQKVRDGLAG